MTKVLDLFQLGNNLTNIIKNYEKKHSTSIPILKSNFHVSFVNRIKRQAMERVNLDDGEIDKKNQQILELQKSISSHDMTGYEQFTASSYMQPNTYASFVPTFFPFQYEHQQQEQQQQFTIQSPVDSNDQKIESIYFSNKKNLPNAKLISPVPLYCTYIPAPSSYQLATILDNPTYDDVFPQNSQAHIDKAKFLGYCPINHYHCNDGITCISKLKWCDNNIDCPDASDETKCTCRDRINQKKLCDYYDDCPYGEDEFGCFGCPENSLSCNDLSGNCISLEERCNGSAICKNGKDEKNCNILTDSYNYENDMISVSSYSGFLQRNLRGRWYPVCGYAHFWAKDACISQLGSITKEPVFELVRIPEPSKRGSYLIDDGYSGKLISECLQGIAYVRCPILTINTPFDQPLYNDPYQVQRKQTNATSNSTNTDPIVGIVGGHNSLPRVWPFIVAINKNGHFHCGGILISEWWILSAAHCFNNYKYHYYDIDAGVLRRFSYSPSRQTRHLRGLIIHENYNSLTLQNDIALGLLTEPVLFNNWVRPARLPESDNYDGFSMWKPQQPYYGQICIAVGWGAIHEGGSDLDHLQEVELAITNCTQPNDRNRAEICAGYREGGRDACQGDSGGPLICRTSDWNDDWYVGGIVSHGIGCGRRNEPGAYTRVSHFRNWINSIIYNRTASEGIQRTRSSCPGFTCNPPHPKCLSARQRCDGVVNCLGAEDEINCPNFTVRKLLDRLFG